MNEDSPKIRYEFEADTSKVEKAFDDLDKKVEDTKNELGEGFTINWGEGQGSWEEYQEYLEKATKEAEEYAKQQEQVSQVSRETSTTSKSTAKDIEQVGDSAKRAALDFEPLEEAFYQAVGSMNDVSAKAQALFAAVLPAEKAFVSSSLEAYASSEDALYGLMTTVDNVKGSMVDAMGEIRSIASEGLLSEEDVTVAMRNLTAYGYSVQEAATMIRAMTISAEANRKENYSVSEAVMAATQGIKQGSAMMSKYAGNTQTAADAEKLYAASLGKKTSELTKAEKRQAIYNSTLIAGQQYSSQAAAYSNTYSASVQRLENSLDNLKSAFGQAFAPIGTFINNLAAFIIANKEVVVGVMTFVGVIAGTGGVVWALSKLIPAISSAIAWFSGLNVVAKGVVLGLATVATAMAVVSLVSSQMAQNTEAVGIGLDDSADAMDNFSTSTGGASKSVNDLNKQLAKLERDYLEELKQVEVSHKETIDKLTEQIYEANVDYRRAIEERNAEFAVSQAKEEKVHQEKVDELMTQIEFLRRYNNDYNKQKLENLEFALAKENALYQKQTEAAKAELDLQNENDRVAYEKKRAELQAELDDELAFMNRHREDLKAVQNVILLDEIDSLKRRYEEQKTSYQEQAALANSAGGKISDELVNAFKEKMGAAQSQFAQMGADSADAYSGNFIDNVNKALTSDNGFFAGLSQRFYNLFSGNGFTNETFNWVNGKAVGSGKHVGWASGGYTGQGDADEVAGIVHKGEYVLPQEFVDQDKGVPKSLGQTVINNIYVNGVFATSAAERRKVADQIVAAMNQNNRARLGAGA